MNATTTARVYVTAARKGRPSRTVIHAFCPCHLPAAPAFEGESLRDAINAAAAIGEYEYCKRSADADTIPELDTDTVTPAPDVEPEPTPELPTYALLGNAVGHLLARLVTEPADERTAWVELSVDNMDNAGSVRRDGVTALIETMGGACDTFGVKNESGSGIYSFTIRALVPGILADALPTLVPAIVAETDRDERDSAKQLRADLKAQGAGPKMIAGSDALHRRKMIAAGIAVYTDATAVVMDAPAARTWTAQNATVLGQIAATVASAARARRAAAKSDRLA
jgi:hypothetical protein